ncbi:DegT/DnrJ/EryC1/StrS family aminotransferase [Thalassotalea sediminis]|uniref:DegT/DnrJ/EryC1/StrS family aminotransferase n=1 Tax=Thalassotalea sediminis TaxID=1759089 RepID=UPI0025734A83|nr:aminotransferase class I/II-fold pyridoxal phosphate-dependent enzyme [Thalassotalea sediminis]
MSTPIYVTKPYLPAKEKYTKYIDSIYQNNQLTNNGPLVQQLTKRLQEKLGVKYLLLVSNGTTALQIAYKIKCLENKHVITTPYSFAATSTALDWQQAHIHLANIDNKSWNICPNALNEKIQEVKAEAIIPVNLFGVPCDLEAIDRLAVKYNIPVIYDSAHALLSEYKGKSIFEYGDIHCISFHATKLFHCIEGGAIIFKDKAEYELANNLINFGITSSGQISHAGINGKLSEFHAAMGLCVLDDIDELVQERSSLIQCYKEQLNDLVTYQETKYDHYAQPIYMPVKFDEKGKLDRCEKSLNKHGYFPRRYFLPQHLDFLPGREDSVIQQCKQAVENILCLPLMNGLDQKTIKSITQIIKSS